MFWLPFGAMISFFTLSILLGILHDMTKHRYRSYKHLKTWSITCAVLGFISLAILGFVDL